MDRRTALFSTLLLGGSWPTILRARAQERDRPPTGFRPAQATYDEPPLDARVTPANADPQPDGGDVEPFRPPASINQAGLEWGVYNIAPYTALPHSRETKKPESAVVEWIFRYTGSEVWHGEDLSVLSVTPKQLRVFHRPEMLAKVNDVYRRFVDPWFDLLTLRVRLIAATDPRWRYDVFSRLEPVKLTNDAYGGPHGQQAWTLDPDAAKMVLATMGLQNSFRTVHDQRYDVVNGQTLFIRSAFQDGVAYREGLDRSNKVALGFEQRVESITEGVELRLSPLLHSDPTALDLAVDLNATVVRKLHPTRVIAPRQIGPAEMTIEIPEVGHTRLNQTLPGWPLDRTLILSAGILPGILMEKSGPLGLPIPGTTPTQTELLVFLDVRSNLESARRPSDRRSQ